MRRLRGRISGLCLPTYVLDIPGGRGKVPVEGEYVHYRSERLYEADSPIGERVLYRD